MQGFFKFNIYRWWKLFLDTENLGDNQLDNNVDNEYANFEKGEENLEKKLKGLNLENEENCQEKEIFEEEETIKEFDKINYIRYKNGKTKIKTKFDGNIIEN